MTNFTFTKLALVLVGLLTSFAALSQITTPFSDDLKTGQAFSFQQRDAFFSQMLDQEVTYRLDYSRWQPMQNNGHVIVYNHGLQSHRAWFNNTAETLSSMGYTVYAFDRIGSGTSSDAYAIEGYHLGLEDFLPQLTDINVVKRRGHIQDYHMFLNSIDRMLDIVERENPNTLIHLWANSYGAKIITRYLLDGDRSKRVSSAVFTTPGLFRNKESMPLPFSKLDLIFSRNSDTFASPVTPLNQDNGASWFTELEPWLTKIKLDPLSVRHMTRKMALQTRAMDQYIAEHSKTKNALHGKPRLYLLVDQDPMMDNEKVIEHINQNKPGSAIKVYQGGVNHKHFLTFTPDRNSALQDIHEFISLQSAPSKPIARVMP